MRIVREDRKLAEVAKLPARLNGPAVGRVSCLAGPLLIAHFFQALAPQTNNQRLFFRGLACPGATQPVFHQDFTARSWPLAAANIISDITRLVVCVERPLVRRPIDRTYTTRLFFKPVISP